MSRPALPAHRRAGEEAGSGTAATPDPAAPLEGGSPSRRALVAGDATEPAARSSAGARGAATRPRAPAAAHGRSAPPSVRHRPPRPPVARRPTPSPIEVFRVPRSSAAARVPSLRSAAGAALAPACGPWCVTPAAMGEGASGGAPSKGETSRNRLMSRDLKRPARPSPAERAREAARAGDPAPASLAGSRAPGAFL